MENTPEQQAQVQPPVSAQVPVGVNSTSSNGTGGTVEPNGPFPAELNHWNWGAFLLTWIWALGNHVWIGLLVFASIIPVVGSVISLVMLVLLGMKGNEWAWKAKKWDSIEHFKTVQKKWAKWGVILLIVGCVVFMLVIGGMFWLVAYLGSQGMNHVQY